ncbi:MAG: hypothetical protein EHM24_19255 [Acidobacteria bacterium]|nr:MAG: hypothetical protein EHM24_19255 [Acidobacteriota bacterium]
MTRTRILGFSLLSIVFVGATIVAAQSPDPAAKSPAVSRPGAGATLTRPERTKYMETSSYEDVITYMKAMAAASPQIHLTTYGHTFEGRALPLAVIGAPNASPEAVLATKKTRIYIQGNIHAGEVEGKEAALWLLRSIARGERAGWFKSVVLLINPIYNADGNEKVNIRNRGRQNGPIGGMGQRPNAQNLDLNRDCTKLESSEGRSLAWLMSRYDPHIAIDLHTTNGSPHGFYVTYQTSVSPNTSPGLTSLVRGDLFPTVTKSIKAKHGWDYFYYGNLSRQGERAWYNDAELYKPRYTQTYFGIRNRVGILVETYAYATFEDRIKSNYWFLEEVVDYAVKNGDSIRKATAAADAESIVGTEQAVRGKLVKEAQPVPIVLADTVDERNPYVPDRPMLRRVSGSERTETMPHYATVEPTETSTAPRAFVFPAVPAGPGEPAGGGGLGFGGGRPPGAPGAGGPPAGGPPAGGPPGGPPPAAGQAPAGQRPGAVSSPYRDNVAALNRMIDRLAAHGIRFTRLVKEQAFAAERFRIATSTTENVEYQGHKLRTVTGKWETTEATAPAGSIVVPMDQPLARLAFLLLDPRSDDGLMAWGLLDEVLGKTPAPEYYPILRTMTDVK